MRPEMRRCLPAALAALASVCLPASAADKGPEGNGVRLSGFIGEEVAYTYDDPTHWSRGVTRLQLSAEGKIGSAKWKIGGRADFDPVIANSGFYLDRVKDDQRSDFFWRETYLDFSAGDWEFRLGAQNIVWGEVVGLFFADVVSARDLREFLLPSFDIIRQPQWAARGEYFFGDSKLELVWIPVPYFDNIGKPGSDFYPAPLPSPTPQAVADQFRDPAKPDRNLSNSSFGVRLGTLADGWDLAAFYYRAFATSPTFYRTAAGAYEPSYDRISQTGGTVSKDLGSMVLRAEAVYSYGQYFSTTDPAATDGVVRRNTLDWIVSGEVPFESWDGRINLQLFQRMYFGGSADDITINVGDFGASVLVAAKVTAKIEPSLQWIQAFGGGGSMIRPRLAWYPVQDLTLAIGADVFTGSAYGYFGRYANRDRAYLEARYSF